MTNCKDTQRLIATLECMAQSFEKMSPCPDHDAAKWYRKAIDALEAMQKVIKNQQATITVQRKENERLQSSADMGDGLREMLYETIRNRDKRIAELEALVTEAVGVCDDLIEKTDIYLGINDAYKRHDLWEKRVQALKEKDDEGV